MTCRHCQGIEDVFDDGTARKDLRRYRRRGPSRTTRLMLAALEEDGVAGRTFLDVGGGIGAVQHELLAQGAAGGVHVDASPAYLETARAEAERRGNAGRVSFRLGDVVELARSEGDGSAPSGTEGTPSDAADRCVPSPPLPPADLVTLDRVVCCYPHMEALVDATASRARRAYAVVFPRVTLLTRLGLGLLNAVQRIRRHPFHVYLHDPGAVEERIVRHGLEKRVHHRTLLWQVLVFFRAGAGPTG